MVVLHSTVAATDAALLAGVRLGDPGAFAALQARHRPAVALYAALSAPDDDLTALVDEAFARVRAAVRRCAGPTACARTHLLNHARRIAAGLDRRRWQDRLAVDLADYPVPFREPAPGAPWAEVALAFSVLPEAWQAVVWHREVEREPAEEVAAVVGVAVSRLDLLADAARSALQQALAPALPRQHGSALRRRASGPVSVLGERLPAVLARHLLHEDGPTYLAGRAALATA